RAFVYHGSVSGLSVSANWIAESDQADAAFGWSVSTAGDVNGDGYSDIITGVPFYDNGQSNEGQVRAYYGSASGLAVSANWTVESNQADAALSMVSGAGDVNGDGYSDIIVSAYYFDNGEADEGRVFVYYGNSSGGLSVKPRQFKSNDTPLALGNQSDNHGFKIGLFARTPAGRTRVKLWWENKPAGTNFNGANLSKSTSWTDIGTAGTQITETITSLADNTKYHWRVRSQYFPQMNFTPWYSIGPNGWSEADFQTSEDLSVVQFTAASSEGAETTTSVNLALSLSDTYDGNVSVDYAVSGGSATSISDYTLVAGTALISAGATTTNIPLAVINDSLDEENETITISLSNPVNAALGTRATHTYTITNDDTPPAVTLQASPVSLAEEGPSSTLTASLSALSAKNITVNLAFSGNATLNADYTVGASITIPAGSGSNSINLSLIDDLLDEEDESIVIDIDSIANGTEGSVQQQTISIVDDDEMPAIAFALSSGEGGESVLGSLEVSLSTVSGRNVSVNYTVSNGTATGSGIDYSLSAGLVVVTAGQTSANITIDIVDDGLDEENETIVIALSNSSNASLGSNTTHTYTINDNDDPPLVNLSVSALTLAEDGSFATVMADLSTVSGKNATVNLDFSGSAALTSDYERSGTTIAIPAGGTRGNITLSSVADSLDEEDETIIIALFGPVNLTPGNNRTKQVTIIDDDGYPEVKWSYPGLKVQETAVSRKLEVSLSVVSSKAVTVNYAVTGGTATGEGIDYTLPSGTAIILPGTTTTTIPMDITYDSQREGDETVEIALRDPTNASLGAVSSLVVTVADWIDPASVADELADSVWQKIIQSPLIETIAASLSPAARVIAGGVAIAAGGIRKTLEMINVSEDQVQVSLSASAMVVTTISIPSAATANVVTIFSLPEFIRSFWYSVAAFLMTRRRNWGRVIEQDTGIAIPGVRLSLITLDETKRIMTTYTDSNGSFAFAAPPGRYRLQVIKDLYGIVTDKFGSFKPEDIIEAKDDEHSLVVPTIVMKMKEDKLKSRQRFVFNLYLFERVAAYFSFFVLLLGTVVAIDSLISEPNSKNSVFIGIYLIFWLVNAKNLLRCSPWGRVVEENGNNPIALALVRVINSKNGKLIKTAITNEMGKFSIFVARGIYKVVVSKTGHEKREIVPFVVLARKKALDHDIELKASTPWQPRNDYQ
ncbi:MAG: Calx-beta domain-containing protein, partial [Patescibacteria group bacterium]